MCQIRKILHLFLQQIAFKNLVQRNKQKEREQGPPAANTAIHLPFIIVNTSKKTVIDCSISNDKWVLGRKDILPHINSGFVSSAVLSLKLLPVVLCAATQSQGLKLIIDATVNNQVHEQSSSDFFFIFIVQPAWCSNFTGIPFLLWTCCLKQAALATNLADNINAW